MFLGLPDCLILLLTGLIVCWTFGFSLRFTIAELVGHAWRSGMSGTELNSDLQVSDVYFAIGAITMWVSSKLFAQALRASRKASETISPGHIICSNVPKGKLPLTMPSWYNN
jgi:hypothetical protein